jgi:hypothetical protein
MFGMEGAEGTELDFGMVGAALSTWLGRVWFEVFIGGVARAGLWDIVPWAVWLGGAGFAGVVAAGIARASGEAWTALAVTCTYTALLTGMVVAARWVRRGRGLDLIAERHGRILLSRQTRRMASKLGRSWRSLRPWRPRAPSSAFGSNAGADPWRWTYARAGLARQIRSTCWMCEAALPEFVSQ